MADPTKLLEELLEFDTWLNAPPSREVPEHPDAHAYRFVAYLRWEKIGAPLAAILRSLAAVQPPLAAQSAEDAKDAQRAGKCVAAPNSGIRNEAEQPSNAHLSAPQTSAIRGDTGREAPTVEGLHSMGDYIKLAPESWDRDYAEIWAKLHAAEHNKLVYRRLWKAERLASSLGASDGWIASPDGLSRRRAAPDAAASMVPSRVRRPGAAEGAKDDQPKGGA